MSESGELTEIRILAPEEDSFCGKRLCVIVSLFRRIGEHISLELFYFFNIASSCSFIPQLNVVLGDKFYLVM